MITQKQMEENFDKLEPLGFPSIREIIEYAESGEDDRNALEYEGLDKLNKKIFEEHTIEELLEYDGSNLGRLL